MTGNLLPSGQPFCGKRNSCPTSITRPLPLRDYNLEQVLENGAGDEQTPERVIAKTRQSFIGENTRRGRKSRRPTSPQRSKWNGHLI